MEAVIAHDFIAGGSSQPGRGFGFVRRGVWDTLSLHVVENIHFHARVLEGREGGENDHDQQTPQLNPGKEGDYAN